MSYQREREDFIERMTREGLPMHVTRLLLREATGINRRAELACSSEAADRDRVPCPASLAFKGLDQIARDKAIYDRRVASGKYPCLCDDYPAGSHANGQHNTITRITLQDWRAEERIRKALATCAVTNLAANAGPNAKPGELYKWDFTTEGDPRGYTLKVIPPSYAERNQGKDRFNQDSIGVPPGPSRLGW